VKIRGMVGVRSDASQAEAKSHHALVSQNLLRAANDGYDVSPLLECGADPMSSGESHLCRTSQTGPVCPLACPRDYCVDKAVPMSTYRAGCSHYPHTGTSGTPLSLQAAGRAHVRNKAK
jgi:hypothetical protein